MVASFPTATLLSKSRVACHSDYERAHMALILHRVHKKAAVGSHPTPQQRQSEHGNFETHGGTKHS